MQNIIPYQNGKRSYQNLFSHSRSFWQGSKQDVYGHSYERNIGYDTHQPLMKENSEKRAVGSD